jgi:putative protease
MPAKPELLAPVGSWEALVAAVQNGADAVYLGGKMFSARQFADNFDREELLRAVKYAHVRGVRVFVTVNTLVADHELTELVDYLRYLYEIGVDAVIVQDLGVIRLVRKLLPGLKLHASTQMTVHNAAGVRLMQEMGIERTVLSRELSRKDIIAIKQATGAELEVFVHGALCICYSGQCLMSSLIGGRSGNRGRCAQPCRLEYTLVDEQGKHLADPGQIGSHLLSPRDLKLIRHLPDLAAAGVDSLKIEGRMKRPEYVATVVRIYRRALDRALTVGPDPAVTESGAPVAVVTAEEEKQLVQIFNREFTTAYFNSRPDRDMMSYKRPNNRGLKLGRVSGFSREKGMIEIQLEDTLRLGDGIEIWVTEGGRRGTEVNKIILDGRPVEEAGPGDRILVPVEGRVRTGDRVFKTHDAALIREARQTFTSPQETKKIPLLFKVFAAVGGHVQITVRDGEGRELTAEGAVTLEKAEKKPLTEEALLGQLDRLGNTPFAVGGLEADIEPGVMVPLSEINEVRRRVIVMMEEQRVAEKRPQPVKDAEFAKALNAVLDRGYKEAIPPGKEDTTAVRIQPATAAAPLLTAAVGSLEAVKQAALKGADVIYYGGSLFTSGGAAGRGQNLADDIRRAWDICSKHNVTLTVRIPRIIQESDLPPVLGLLEFARDNGLGVLIGNPGILKIAGEMSISRIQADFPLNIFNSQALLWVKERGICQAALSTELTLEQIKDIAGHGILPVETIIHGALPMMVSEHCVIGSVLGGPGTAEEKGARQACGGTCAGRRCGLKDRMGMTFPLRTDIFCRTHLYNAREMCLLEYIKPLCQAGINALRVELEINEAGYTALVVGSYREELDKYLNNPGAYRPPGEGHRLIKALGGAFTKGHYYRGVV